MHGDLNFLQLGIFFLGGGDDITLLGVSCVACFGNATELIACTVMLGCPQLHH